MGEPTLLPCPFTCVGEIKFYSYPDNECFWQCTQCGCMGPSSTTRDKATAAWNRRIQRLEAECACGHPYACGAADRRPREAGQKVKITHTSQGRPVAEPINPATDWQGPSPATAVCERCEGQGTLPPKLAYYTCPKCDGTGKPDCAASSAQPAEQPGIPAMVQLMRHGGAYESLMKREQPAEQRSLPSCSECPLEPGGPCNEQCEEAAKAEQRAGESDISEDRIRNLRAWAAARVGSLSGADVTVAVCDEVLRLRSSAPALKEDARDAARYRWLRALSDANQFEIYDMAKEPLLLHTEYLDAAIDAAMTQTREGAGK